MADKTITALAAKAKGLLTRAEWRLALAVVAFYLAFAVYTDHAWEDWYITFKASKNLATGNGLGYMPGVPVHSFTSVLGTLIPALLSWVTFNHSDTLVLWLYRIVNIGVMAWTAVLLFRSAGRWFSGPLPVLLVIVATFFESKIVDFTINGMETPYTLLGLALFLHITSAYPIEKQGVRLGVAWALLQYARPDGFLFALLLSAGLLAFTPNRRATLKALALAAGIGFLLFLPWLAFAFWYFGNPIPHSMIAKSVLREISGNGVALQAWKYLTSFVLLKRSLLDILFLPANIFATSPPEITVWNFFSRILTITASLLWIVPGIAARGRIASFATLGFSLYLVAVAPYVASWYTPGLILLAVVSLAFGLDAFLRRFATRPRRKNVFGKAAVSAVVVFTLGMTLVAAQEFRYAQQIIERGQREQIGLWLKRNATSPDETVFLECVGYIGFYSGLKMYDWPGMTSPEMVRARREVGAEDFGRLIQKLEPDWLVLRPHELSQVMQSDSIYLMTHYTVREVFDSEQTISDAPFLPYSDYLDLDAVFFVVQRILPPTGR
jgi:hypothetical protein